MYNKSVVKIIICNIETYINFKVGVKQGDSMAPGLFLFLMMAFDETLEDEWMDLGLQKSQFAHKDNSPRSTIKLVIHQPGTFSSGDLFDIFCMVCVYYCAFVFESRNDRKKRITFLSNHFARFGLKMHIGMGGNTSNTECVFFLSTFFFNARNVPLTDLTNSILVLQKNKARKIDTHVRMKNITSAKNSDHQSNFTKHFKYLGRYISYSL